MREHQKQRDATESRSDDVATDDRVGGDPRRARALAHRVKQHRQRGQVVEAPADEMSEVEVDAASIQEVRNRLVGKVDRGEERAMLALNRFQSILRERDAGPALEGGLGATLKDAAVDWLVERLRDGLGVALEGAELPLAVVPGAVKAALQDETQAEQARAKLGAVDAIVDVTFREITSRTRAARDAVRACEPMRLFKADAASEGEVVTTGDVDELVQRLLGMLTEALCRAPSTTAAECGDMIQRDRGAASVEADQAGRRMKE